MFSWLDSFFRSGMVPGADKFIASMGDMSTHDKGRLAYYTGWIDRGHDRGWRRLGYLSYFSAFCFGATAHAILFVLTAAKPSEAPVAEPTPPVVEMPEK